MSTNSQSNSQPTDSTGIDLSTVDIFAAIEAQYDSVDEFIRSEELSGELSSHIVSRARERPAVLEGVTYFITTGYGELRVTINVDGHGQPFEVFADIGKSGEQINSVTESIGKSISIALRAGTDPRDLANELRNIQSPKIAWDNGDKVLSIPDGIGMAIERYLEEDLDISSTRSPESSADCNDGFSEESADDSSPNEPCPDCGSLTLNFSEGCKTCESCGWSEC